MKKMHEYVTSTHAVLSTGNFPDFKIATEIFFWSDFFSDSVKSLVTGIASVYTLFQDIFILTQSLHVCAFELLEKQSSERHRMKNYLIKGEGMQNYYINVVLACFSLMFCMKFM